MMLHRIDFLWYHDPYRYSNLHKISLPVSQEIFRWSQEIFDSKNDYFSGNLARRSGNFGHDRKKTLYVSLEIVIHCAARGSNACTDAAATTCD